MFDNKQFVKCHVCNYYSTCSILVNFQNLSINTAIHIPKLEITETAEEGRAMPQAPPNNFPVIE